MHEARFRRSLLFILRQWTTKVRWISSSLPLAAGHKTQAGEKVKTALPRFHRKLKVWSSSVDAEIDANTKNFESLVEAGNWGEIRSRGMGVDKLRVVNDTIDPMQGRYIEFELPAVKDQDVYKLKSGLLKQGVPVDVCAGTTFKRISEGNITNFERATGAITVKLIRQYTGTAKLSRDSECSLLKSSSRGSLHSLRLFFEEIAEADPKFLPGNHLLKYAFGGKSMPVIDPDRKIDVTGNLDESQQRCVNAALNRKRPFVIIQGPPGTGKTRTVSEIIVQLVRDEQRVLVCAPTNTALSNCVQSVKDAGGETNSMVELIGNDVWFSLKDDILKHDKYEKLRLLNVKVLKTSEIGAQDSKEVLELRELRHEIVADILSNKSAIFCTTASSMCHRILMYGWFPDVVIIEEAGQCKEASSWMPLLSGSRCILAGDHQQLPAIVVSQKARASGFDISLMERLATDFKFKNSNSSFLLDTQYRMNETIMRWPSYRFYEGRLKADNAVQGITLSEIGAIPLGSLLNAPVIAIDTSMMNFREQMVGKSWKNIGEKLIIVDYVQNLIDSGVRGEDLGVITPYFAQMKELADAVPLKVEVNTVDGFQGREKQVIVFGVCRDNAEGSLGFVADRRRLNVAVTRAKRQFVLVGNKRMMGGKDVLKSLWEFICKEGAVVDANELETVFRNTLHELNELEGRVNRRNIAV